MNESPENIILRRIGADDLDTLMELTGNPDVIRYLPGMIQDREYAEAWIQNLTPDEHEFMICLGESIIGECSLSVQSDSGEIGLMLFPEFWRKGYGTETIRLLTELAKELGLRQISASTAAENIACTKLLTKQGFKPQGVGWVLNDEDFDKKPDQLFSVAVYVKPLKDEHRQ